MTNRHQVLADLLELKHPLPRAIKQLETFSFDYEGEPYIVTKSHIRNAVTQFLNGSINSAELEGWAEIVEVREDLECDPEHKAQISNAVFDLANPILQGQITTERCEDILVSLD